MTLRVEQKEPDLKVKTKITGGPQGDLDFGYRRDELTREKGPHATACQPAAGSALLRGETMISWRVWDVMRSIDWIGTRPELAADRVGCLGISSGGTCTLFSAALDLRIKAAFVSGYLNPFRDSIMSISHCIDNYVPGILNWAENYDIAGLIAPRPLCSERGDQDPIFPLPLLARATPVRSESTKFSEPGLTFSRKSLQGNTRFTVYAGCHFSLRPSPDSGR